MTVAARPRLEICFDTVDPDALVAFWSQALGYVRGGGSGDPYTELVHPDGPQAGIVITVQRVPEAKVGKNRLHLDLYLADPHAHVERLEALGARRVGDPVQGSVSWFQVMQDPEGNEFCVCSEVEGDAA